MKWKKKRDCPPSRWFAWYPVITDYPWQTRVWMEKVTRWRDYSGDWHYQTFEEATLAKVNQANAKDSHIEFNVTAYDTRGGKSDGS